MERAEIQFLVIIITVVLIVLIGSIFALVNYVMRKRIEYVRNQERSKAEQEEAILNTKIEISEQQYHSISMELHDNVGQLLSVASMELEMLNRENNTPALLEIQELVSSSLEEIRAISKGMNTQLIIESSLFEMIEAECDRINRMKLCVAQVSQSNKVSISGNQRVVFFRIIQEFISNTIKHSKAKHFKVSIEKKGNKLVIKAEDDGVGFDPEHVKSNNGLINMKKRASLIGASFNLVSSSNCGCRLTLTLPLEQL